MAWGHENILRVLNYKSLDALNHEPGSVADVMVEANGVPLSTDPILINPGAGAHRLFIFQVFGVVRIYEIFFVVVSVVDSTVFSLVKFESYDGTVTSDACTEKDCSGAGPGALYGRYNKRTLAGEYIESDQAQIIDPGIDSGAVAPFMATQKYGVNSFICLSFTANEDTELIILTHARWSPINGVGSRLILV